MIKIAICDDERELREASFRILRFGQTFLPPLGHFGEEKNSPISSSKKFPAVFDALLPFFCCKNATTHPDFFFL